MTFLDIQNRMGEIEVALTDGELECLYMLNEYVALYIRLQKGKYETE